MSGMTLAVLAVGSLFAVILAAHPLLLLWVTTIYTLIIVGLTGYFFPNAKVIGWVAYGAAALMYIYMLRGGVRSTLGRREILLPLSLFFFIFISLVSTAYSLSPIFQIVVAVKSLFMFGGMWIFFAYMPVHESTMKKWLKLIFGIGLIQWLPAIYQYVFVRSYRLGAGLGAVESSDSVVGTFGGSMESGGLTAVLALFLVLLILAVIALLNEKILNRKRSLVLLMFLVIPLLIMEVKIIFFYLPVGLAILFKSELIKRPMFAVLWGVGMSIILGGLLIAYQYFHWSAAGEDWGKNIESSFSYSFQSKGGYFAEQSGALTRLGAIEFWAQEHSEKNYARALIGHGLGSSRTRGQVLGIMAYKLAPKNIDQTGLAMMLWDVGVFGVCALFGVLFAMFRRANFLVKSADKGTWERVLARTLNAAIPLFAMSLLYRNDIPYAAPMMFIMMSVFGLTSWLKKNQYYSREVRT